MLLLLPPRNVVETEAVLGVGINGVPFLMKAVGFLRSDMLWFGWFEKNNRRSRCCGRCCCRRPKRNQAAVSKAIAVDDDPTETARLQYFREG